MIFAGLGCGSVGSNKPDSSGSGGTSGSGGNGGSGGGAGGGGGGAGGSSGGGGSGGQPGDGGQPDAATDGGQATDAPADTGGGGGDGGGGPTCPTLPNGLVSWWHGDGDYTDSTGAVSGASAGGVTFAAGAIGQTFVLDGTASAYVQMPDAAPLRITGPMTLDAWVRPTAAAAGGRIIDKIMVGGANGYTLDMVTGQARLLVGADSLLSGVTIPMGVFSHIAGVYSGTSISVFVNGVLAATKTTTVATVPSNNLPFRIGADSAGNTRFTGAIDEPRLFGRALSAVEIQSIYQAGSPAHCACVAPLAGLVSWWRGDGNLSDSRGSNTGTDSGGVMFNSGAVGSGISLNGAANSYVLVPDATTLQIAGSLTIEAWINPTVLAGRVVDKIMAGGTNGYYMDITPVVAAGGGLLRFGVGTDIVASPTALTAAKFSHVAGVYDGTTLSIYVNGARVANKTTLVTAVPTSTLPLRIGADSAGATRFNGIIDEPRLYNRALTADEVSGLYRAGAAARCAP